MDVIEFEPVRGLRLENPRLSDYSKGMLRERDRRFIQKHMDEWGFAPMAGGASFSDYLELKVLDHIFNDGTFTVPSTVALALCTTAPTDASTGATLVEATYTGYARLAIAASDMSAAAAGSKTNSAVLTFAACTASSSTIIGWATADSASTGAGNVLVWGTATSTVISTTQTPATIAASGLVVNLD